MMHLKGLKRAVKKLAPKGKYHSAAHHIVEHHDGEVIHKWDVYIADVACTGSYATPEQALQKLREEIAEKLY